MGLKDPDIIIEGFGKTKVLAPDLNSLEGYILNG